MTKGSPPLDAGNSMTIVYTATHCNTLQNTATHCNTLQHTATDSKDSNRLQYTATHLGGRLLSVLGMAIVFALCIVMISVE